MSEIKIKRRLRGSGNGNPSGHSHAGGLGHSHAHAHSHGGGGSDHVPRVLSRAMMVTVAFMLVETIGGYWANSLALLSDAAHMLTDVGAMLLSYFIYHVTRRPSNDTLTFGYHRAEILGALGSGLGIWVLAGILVYEAFARLASPPAVNGPMVVGIAGLGLLANLGSMWFLRQAQKENLNVRAAYLHLLTDMIGSVGALGSGAVLWFVDWRPIDPLITLFSAALMLWSSWGLIRESIAILMESTPSHLDAEQIRRELGELVGVTEVHDLHIWTVSSGRFALSVHLVAADHEKVLQDANQWLENEYGIVHTTIQIEHPDRFRSERCYDCAGSASS